MKSWADQHPLKDYFHFREYTYKDGLLGDLHIPIPLNKVGVPFSTVRSSDIFAHIRDSHITIDEHHPSVIDSFDYDGYKKSADDIIVFEAADPEFLEKFVSYIKKRIEWSGYDVSDNIWNGKS